MFLKHPGHEVVPSKARTYKVQFSFSLTLYCSRDVSEKHDSVLIRLLKACSIELDSCLDGRRLSKGWTSVNLNCISFRMELATKSSFKCSKFPKNPTRALKISVWLLQATQFCGYNKETKCKISNLIFQFHLKGTKKYSKAVFCSSINYKLPERKHRLSM